MRNAFLTQTIDKNIIVVQIVLPILFCVTCDICDITSLTACLSQHEGLHLDLRELDTVRLVRDKRSNTGLAAVLGPGNTWARVLKVIPPDRSVVLSLYRRVMGSKVDSELR